MMSMQQINQRSRLRSSRDRKSTYKLFICLRQVQPFAFVLLLHAVSLLGIPSGLFILLMVFANKDPIKEHWWRCLDANDSSCANVYAKENPGQDFCSLQSHQYEWTHASRSIISDFNLTCSKAIFSQLVNSAFFLGYLIGSGLFGPMADGWGRRKTLFTALGITIVGTAVSAISPNYWVYLASRILTGSGSAGQGLVAYLLATESIGPKWRGLAGVVTQMFFILGEFTLVFVAFMLQPWRQICYCAVGLGVASVLLLLFVPESPRWLLAKGRVDEATAVLQRIADANGTRLPLEPLMNAGSPQPTSPHADSTPNPYSPAPGGFSPKAADNTAMAVESAAMHHGVATSSSSSSSIATTSSGSNHSLSDTKKDPELGELARNTDSSCLDSSPAGKGIAAVKTAAAQPAQPSAATPISLSKILRDKHICRRFLILAYVWCVLCMTYYGISLALNGLKGSIYVTFLISAAAEIPSNLLGAYLIERAGRHNSLAAGMLLGGVACLLCALCPAGTAQGVLAAVGKFGCAGAFTIASIYTSELFPTLVRSAVLGVENEAARIGGIAAPFIVLLGVQTNNTSFPFLVFGSTSILAAILITTLPETLGAPMPDTMKDMDAIKSIFTTKAWRNGWRETRQQLFSTRAFKARQAAKNLKLPTIEEGGMAAVDNTDTLSKSTGSSSSGIALMSKTHATDGCSDEITHIEVVAGFNASLSEGISVPRG